MTDAAQSWRHTFQLVLAPTLIDDFTVTPCANPTSGTCQAHAEYVRLLNELSVSLNTTFRHLQDTFDALLTAPSVIRSDSRQKRALLGFIGDISHSLFGTARASDLERLAKYVRLLANKQHMMSNVANLQTLGISHMLNMTNARLDNLVSATQDNHQDIVNLANDINAQVNNRNAYWITMFALMTRQLKHFTLLEIDMRKKMEGICSLTRHELSPDLITPQDLDSMFSQIDATLRSSYPSYHITHRDYAFYYDQSILSYARSHHSLFIVISVPLSTTSGVYSAYHVSSYPIPIHDDQPHVTRLDDFSPIFLISEDKKHFAELSTLEFDTCYGTITRTCHFPILRQDISEPTCLAGIFVENTTAIATCPFSLYTNALVPQIVSLSHTDILLINVSTYNLSCADITRQISGCKFCIITIPCHCDFRSLNFRLPQRIRDCINSTSPSTRHVLNVALLQQFFNASTLETFNATYAQASQRAVSLPQIRLVSHDFSDFMTTDKRLKLDLKRTMQRVMQNKSILTTPSDSIFLGNWSPSSSFFQTYSFPIAITSIILHVLSFLFLFLLYKKLKTLALVLLLTAKPTPALTSATPPLLSWTLPPPSTPPPDNTALHLLESLNPTLSFELCMQILTILLILVLFLKLIFKPRLHSTRLYLSLSDPNGICVNIQLLRLHACLSSLCVTLPTYPSGFTLHYAPFQSSLHISQLDIHVHHGFSAQSWTVPNDISLSLYQAYRLNKLLKSTKYFVTVLLVHGDFTYDITPSDAPHSNCFLLPPRTRHEHSSDSPRLSLA